MYKVRHGWVVLLPSYKIQTMISNVIRRLITLSGWIVTEGCPSGFVKISCFDENHGGVVQRSRFNPYVKLICSTPSSSNDQLTLAHSTILTIIQALEHPSNGTESCQPSE